MNDNTVHVLRVTLAKLYDAGLIADSYYASLLSQIWDAEADPVQFASELTNAIKRVDFYKLIDRIERGEKIIADETDPIKRAGNIKFLHKLIGRLLETGERV